MTYQIPLVRCHKQAIQPRYAHGSGVDNAVDLFACERYVVQPGDTKVVPIGWALKTPPGYGLFVLPRSGASLKTDVRIANAPGLVDHGYRGEVGVLIWNKGDDQIVINPGDRIAQAVLLETPAMMFVEVDSLDDTPRGLGGFGSTD